jgi:hypothetical protein
MQDFEFSELTEVIDIKCTYDELVHISLLEPTQGDLKGSSPEDLDKLSRSLKTHGYIRPIILWWDTTKDEKTRKILDGHQRRTLHYMEAKKGVGTEGYEVPVIYAKAPTIKEAMKVLLQLISTTGELSIEGLSDFVSNNQMNLEEITATMSLKSPSLKKVKQKLDQSSMAKLQKNPDYPIQKQFGESYNSVVIFCDNDIDWVWLQTKLRLDKTKDPNSKYIGQTKVISVSDFQKMIEDDK